MPPRAKRKTKADTHSQKIDSYFKPLPKVKRKAEIDENSQETGRPSPSPPSSQSKPLKSFGENITGTTTFGLKSENENIGHKSFGLKGSGRENIGSKSFGLHQDDCKTFGTTNALKWQQQFDRQPLRDKSITPVTMKMSSISRPVQHTFQVLSDQEIERGIEQSTGSRPRYDDNSQPSSLGSSCSNVKSYPGQSDTQDSFEVYADEAQISDTVRGDIIHSVTNSDDESSPEDKFEVYVDNQAEDKFEVYLDNEEEDKFEVFVDNEEEEEEEEAGFEVYVDKDNEYADKIEVYLDHSSEDDNKFYADQDNESDQGNEFKVYVGKDNESDQGNEFEVSADKDNESDQDSKFKVYVDENETPSDNTFKVYIDENDTQSNNTTATCTIKDEKRQKIDIDSSKITQHQLKEDRRNKENEPVSDSEEKSPNIINSPLVKKSSSTLPDFFKQGTISLSTYGSSPSGFFDEEYEKLVELEDTDFTEEFSIAGFTSELTPEFKEPSAPLFSSKQKHLLQEHKEKR